MARRYSPDELNEILQGAQRDAAKPAPVTAAHVGAQLAQAAIAGAGAALLVGGGMWLLGAPLEPLLNTALTAGVLVLGAGLAVRAFPADRMATFRRIQQVQRFVVEAEFRKREAYRAIERLEAEHAAAIKEWQRAVTELRQENKTLRSEVRKYEEAARTPTYVTRSNAGDQTVKDAGTILEYWYSTLTPDAKGNTRGQWWSRPKAQAAGWTKTRQEAAAQLLLDAGITGIDVKLPFVKMSEYPDLSAALYRLHTYTREATREPSMPPRNTYVELE